MNLIRATRWAIAALIFAGLGWQFSRQDLAALSALRDPSLLALSAALVLGLVSYVAFAMAWANLRGRGETWRGVGGLWFASLFARYAPGGFWQGTVRVAGAHAAGESTRAALERYAAEQLLACFSAATIALLLALFARVGIGRPILLALAGVSGTTLAITFLAPRWGVAVGWNRRAVAMALAGHLAMALGFAIFVAAWTTFEPRIAALSMTAFLAAGVAGVLALFVPAGLGVREVAISWLLTPDLGGAVAISLALASRLWLLACELGAWGSWAILARWHR